MRKSKAEIEDKSAPPSYHECPLPAHLSSPITSNITASNTPQWHWSKLQCKAWLFAVLTTYMDYDATTAEAIVSKLEGYGPNIYSRTKESWTELLGYENGNGLYLMLLSIRHQKGAIPRNVNMNHGYPPSKQTKGAGLAMSSDQGTTRKTWTWTIRVRISQKQISARNRGDSSFKYKTAILKPIFISLSLLTTLSIFLESLKPSGLKPCFCA